MPNDLFTAFFQGFTGAGLFGKARLPGAPTEFIDSRSLEEFHATGEFEENLSKYNTQVVGTTKHSKRSADSDIVRENHPLAGRR